MSQNIILRIASCQELREVIKYHPRGHGYVGAHGELKRNLAEKSIGDPNTASGWSPRAHFMESDSHTRFLFLWLRVCLSLSSTYLQLQQLKRIFSGVKFSQFCALDFRLTASWIGKLF